MGLDDNTDGVLAPSGLELPHAIEKLERWMVHLVLESDGDGPGPRVPVRELAVRLYHDVLPDECLDGASWPAVHAFFVEWLQAQGAEHPRKTTHTDPSYPRFNSPIAIDATTLEGLRTLPDLPPSFATAFTRDEILRVHEACRNAKVWVYDIGCETGFEDFPDEFEYDTKLMSRYRGWMKVKVRTLDYYWLTRISRTTKSMPYEDDPNEPGVLLFC